MPQGKEHLTLWRRYKPLAIISGIFISILGISLYAASGIFWFILLGVFFIMGYSLGYYLDPDFDQEMTTSGKWRMMRTFKILGAFISGWFIPYGYLFKHRSFLSHFPGISTGIRLMWLAVFPLFIFLAYTLIQLGLGMILFPLSFGIWLGLSLADTIHALADWEFIHV